MVEVLCVCWVLCCTTTTIFMLMCGFIHRILRYWFKCSNINVFLQFDFILTRDTNFKVSLQKQTSINMVCRFCPFQNSFNGSFSIQPKQQFFAYNISDNMPDSYSSSDGFHLIINDFVWVLKKKAIKKKFFFFFFCNFKVFF